MREFGDFQTPPALVASILDRLGATGDRWPRVLEPTCGRGAFLDGLLSRRPPPREIRGVEIQAGHHEAAEALAGRAGAGSRLRVLRGDLFALDLAGGLDWNERGPLLVVGNPPWVTTAELGALGSGNGPARANVAGVRGIDAMTGASNFDLAEAVWVKLLTELRGASPTIAMLGKATVARRVLEHAGRLGLAVEDAWLATIDARAWFGASVEACLFCMSLGAPDAPARLPGRIPVYPDLGAAEPSGALGFAGGRLVRDIDAYERFSFVEGAWPRPWRQGLKHDLAPVMELTATPDGRWSNGLGEAVDVEPEHVYPLRKGSDLAARAPAASPRRGVVVTQRRVGEETSGLAASAPRLWAYLRAHDDRFARRKSAVYRGAPSYAMFGVGPYSFAPYKVAVSGLHRPPRFRALGPVDGRPVLLDDTCYLLPFGTPEGAALAAALLDGPAARGFLGALAFPGSKRAVTKAMLQRIDPRALLERASLPALLRRAGADVRRLVARPPRWPDSPLDLLAGDEGMVYERIT